MRNSHVLPSAGRMYSKRVCAAGCGGLLGLLLAVALPSPAHAETKSDKEQAARPPAIVIRPANYDKTDELAYTRNHGDLDPGMAANGRKWNQAPEHRTGLPYSAFNTSIIPAATGYGPPAPAPGLVPPAPAPGAAAAAETGDQPTAAGPTLRPMTYAEAYSQIPFYRSEYEANPSYRNDAALELLFGQLRPTVIRRTTTPYFSRYPDFIRFRYSIRPRR